MFTYSRGITLIINGEYILVYGRSRYVSTNNNMLGTYQLTWKGGVMVFCFVQNFFFSDNTRVRIFFYLSRKARNFFPEINIRLYDKNSESDYFFLPPPKSEYFFQQHWESEYFFRKKWTANI